MTPTDPTLQARFEQAVAASKQLSERPDNVTLLRIYALFKQATDGDVNDEKPGAMDFVGAAKWNARDALRGTAPADAMQRYIALIEELQG